MPNDYDFIMNPQTSRGGGPGLAGPQKLLAIVGIFAVAVIAIILIVSLVFSSPTSGNRQALVNVIAHQTEVTRVIELGVNEVDDLELKQRMQTLNAVVLSDLQEANGIATSRGYTIERFERTAERNTDIDTEIEAAIESRELDAALQSSVSAVANRYLDALNDARGSTSSTSETELYNSAIASLQLIFNEPTTE